MTPAQLATFSPEERAMVDAAMAAQAVVPGGDWELNGNGYDVMYDNRISVPDPVGGGKGALVTKHLLAAQPANVLRTFEALADARIERDRLREALGEAVAIARSYARDEYMTVGEKIANQIEALVKK